VLIIKKINADSIIEYVLCIIALFYVEYTIGIEIAIMYNINRIVLMSFFMTVALSIFITFYVIKTAKFSEFSIKRIRNVKEFLIRVTIAILICVPLTVFLRYGKENMHNSIVFLFLNIFMIAYIIILRIYYGATINKSNFHYCSVFYCLFIIFLVFISFNLAF